MGSQKASINSFTKASPGTSISGTTHLLLHWSRSVKKHQFREEDIFEEFSVFGDISDVIVKDGGRRMAVVSFKKTQDAQRALKQLNGKPHPRLSGRVLHIHFAVRNDEVLGLSDILRTKNVPLYPSNEEEKIENCVPGLYIYYDFITEDDEEEILKSLDEEAQHEWEAIITRRVRHFGYAFDYKKRRCDEKKPLKNMTNVCQSLIDRLPETMTYPDQITANEYIPGQGIADHIDTHSAFEDGIASLSLSGVIVMDFKHPDGRHYSVALPRRSLIVMTKDSRYEWTHGIMSRKTDLIDGKQIPRNRRVSLSFRKIRTGPCECSFKDQCDSHAAEIAEEGVYDSIYAPTSMEKQYVHDFYDKVACHFSSTRYSPWPKVKEFVQSFPSGSILVDIGCGNGKYMKCVPSECISIGGDRCLSLVEICRDQNFHVVVCDALWVPFRSNLFDGALSIAVLHHLSTVDHRKRAIEEISRVLRPGGRGLIYAWAQEQQNNSKRNFDLHKQDVMVPWNLDRRFSMSNNSNASCNSNDIIVQRYCHVFHEDELMELASEIEGIAIEECYYDESNWCIVIRRLR